MKGYALEAKPLSDLLRKTDQSRDGRNIQLDDQCLVSFENLKSLLATAPVLRLYDPCAVRFTRIFSLEATFSIKIVQMSF